MNDERPIPDPNDPPPPQPGPEPEGLLEELREGLEDAVEHLPQPVRWTVSRIAWIAGLSLFGLLVLATGTGLLYLANRTEWVAQEIALFVNQTLALRSDVVLEMKDVRGNLVSGVQVIEPRIRFRTGDAPPVLTADRMTLRYNLWGLATGGRGPIRIQVDRPQLQLVNGPDGKLRVPTWKSAPRLTPSSGRGYDAEIIITNGEVRMPGPVGTIQGLALSAQVATGSATRVNLRSMRWTRGPWGSRLSALEGALETGDSTRVSIRRLVTQDVALSGRAAWSPKGGDKVAHVDIERVRWAWLAVVFQNGAFDAPGQGHARVDIRGDRAWAGRFDADVDWKGLAATGRGEFRTENGRWTVNPLVAQSKAGDLKGRFSYDKLGWEIGGDVQHGDPSQWAAINITGWPEGDIEGRFRYSVDTRRIASRLDAALGRSLLAGWRADSAYVRVDFPPGTARDSFRVHMLRRGGTFDLMGTVLPGGWRGRYRAANLPLDEWPDGRASGLRGTLDQGSGTVEGRDGGLFVTGALNGQQSDWLGAHMSRWQLNDVAGRMLPTPDLTAAARLDDVMYLGIHFDSARAGLALGDARVRLESVDAYAGDTLMTMAGESAWGPAGWSLELSRAAVTSSQLRWTADAPVLLTGDSQGVSFQRLVARDGDARLQVTGHWASPGGWYDWTAHGEHLDVSRLGMPPEQGLGGQADIDLRVRGRSGDPSWTLEGRVSDPQSMGHRGDSLSLALSGSQGRLELTSMNFAYRGGTLGGRGRADGMAPWPDSLNDRGILRWVGTARSWSGDAHARNMPLDDLAALSPQAQGWRGEVSADGTWSGSPARPQFDVRAVAQPIAFRAYDADRATVRASYDGRTLNVEQLQVTRGDLVSTASGRMPLALALGRTPEIPDEAMEWTMTVPGGDLGVLPVFVPQIGAASGRFEANATVRGTPRHPDIRGFVRVHNGIVRLAARDEVVENLEASLRFDGSRLTLDTLSARQGRDGRIRARGEVDLSGLALHGYRFDLSAERFEASEAGLYAADINGDFVITNGPRVRGQSLPQVDGNVRINRATVLFDFANQSEGDQLAATTQPLYWTYRLGVLANDKLRWQPSNADIELSCDLTVEQTRDSLIIFGEMNALRGSYYFLSNRYQVNKANLTFDNLNGVNPVIDASATTRVTASGSPTTPLEGTGSDPGSVTHLVTVEITGRAKEPEIRFTSDPDDWDESQILRALTLGTVYDQRSGAVNLTDPLDSYLTRAINRQLSGELSRTFNNYLNDWQLERERGGLIAGEGGLIVSVSTQPVQNVNVRYRQRLPGGSRDYESSGAPDNPFERSVEAEYRLSRFIYVTSELTQRRTVTGASSNPASAPDFNVNLKARWEY